MITAVDTNVLLDVFANDPDHADRSAALLRRCLREGVVVACDIVWAETAAAFDDAEAFTQAMKTLGIAFSPMKERTAGTAGLLWHGYRKRGGARQRVVANFLVAAHAMEQCDRLLSRDRGFYRRHFSRLPLLDPANIAVEPGA